MSASELDSIDSYERELEKRGEKSNSSDALGGIKWEDAAALKEQRVIIWNFAKTLSKNLFSAMDLTSVPLPVQLFEPESFLQRLATQYMYAPKYLNKASAATDPVERLKFVVTWWIAGMHLMGEQFRKPFNPILGETYQASYEDGSKVYMEQSSHHPPVSCWEVKGVDDAFTFAGWGEFSAHFRGNNIKAIQTGTQNVYFPDGGHITFTLPYIWVTGIAFGDRVMKYCGEMTFTDEQNGLSTAITLNPKKGGLFKSYIGTPDFMKGDIIRKIPDPKKAGKFKNEKVCTMEGSWLASIAFDGTTYWKLEDNTGVKRPVQAKYPLPSNSHFREDVIALSQKDLERGGEYKKMLEEKQRYDAKLRKKGAKDAYKRMKERSQELGRKIAAGEV